MDQKDFYLYIDGNPLKSQRKFIMHITMRRTRSVILWGS